MVVVVVNALQGSISLVCYCNGTDGLNWHATRVLDVGSVVRLKLSFVNPPGVKTMRNELVLVFVLMVVLVAVVVLFVVVAMVVVMVVV